MIIKRLSFLLLFLPFFCAATELAPWYPPIYQVQPCITLLTQHSRSVASSHGDFEQPLHANFLHGSLSGAYYDWYGELEVLLAQEPQRHCGFDSAAGTIRYLLSDDVPGDSFFSSVVALSIKSASRRALYDLSSFHHGLLEGVLHLALGKEFSTGQYWSSRFSAVIGLGTADVGSPWIYSRLGAEMQQSVNQQLGLFLEGLFGLGGEALSRRRDFHGYGPIAHRSIDLCAGYSYLFAYGSKATLGASYRLYARNFPQQAYSFSISFLYPFGL